MTTTTRSEEETTAPAKPPVVVLTHGGTSTERQLVRSWAQEHHPGAPILERDAPDLPEQLAKHGDPEVVPVRVIWVPKERGGDRSVRAADLLALANPRKPPARLQARILRRSPDRVHVVGGEGATVSDMRRRFLREAGRGGSPQDFGAFVRRQAVLALDRADRAIIGDRYKIPRLVAEQITASSRFRQEVETLADQESRPVDEVLAEATEDLEELATVQSRLAIDAFRLLLSPMHARAYKVEVDVEGLERLRELNRRHALVFLPTHRSYADPLILAEVLHDHDFPRNHLLGGNNLAFWPLGPLGKRAGVIFIRRSFGGDRVYKLAMREFLAHLVAKRFNLEWYIEGGRTRTGKLRPPKFGLLHYLARALEEGRADDVTLVPVSINYTRLEELGKIAAEQGGQTKEAEGLGWLAGYMRAQRQRVGTVRIDFGDGMSLKQQLAEAGEGRAQLEKVAFAICDAINQVTPLTTSGVLTLALLGTPKRAMTLPQVDRVVRPLLEYAARRDLPGDVARLSREGELRSALNHLVEAGVVDCYGGGTETVWSIKPGNHVEAAFYRNNTLHHFVNRAICELSLLWVARHDPPGGPEEVLEAAWEFALSVRDLLKFEFFFAEKDAFRLQLRAELDLLDPEWFERPRTSEEAETLLAQSGLLLANRALRSFLDAQLVVSERLAERDPRKATERGPFIDECLGVGRQMVLQGRLYSAESVSKELFGAAWQLAENRDVVDPGRDEVKAARRAFHEEICSLVDLIEQVRILDERTVEEVLDERMDG